ncbi:hypothetical protein STRTUCAR8_08252 [Streptomyces turgidiscabies Car8]|uniref:Uncharacterized protein n=1 Tax=Streptomyces turgidiscabies (strain Car8) TaxID=698760 RepID=L7F576_STRT8|nr:hypothetical protein STRTUCAR8_08252 [Streptomyces turgidiscabies Car8]
MHDVLQACRSVGLCVQRESRRPPCAWAGWPCPRSRWSPGGREPPHRTAVRRLTARCRRRTRRPPP